MKGIKRKIENLGAEKERLQKSLKECNDNLAICQNALDRRKIEIGEYKKTEFEIFVKANSPGLVYVNRFTFAFGSGIVLCLFDGNQGVLNFRGTPFFKLFADGSCNLERSDLFSYDKLTTSLSCVLAVLPEAHRLMTKVFPAWERVSEEYDWESLMTTRVLHWIAKQLHGTMWPDILRDFVIKMV